MPSFKYVAYGKDGKEIKGSIEAESKDAAMAQIKADGLIPTSVSEAGLLDKDLNFEIGGGGSS